MRYDLDLQTVGVFSCPRLGSRLAATFFNTLPHLNDSQQSEVTRTTIPLTISGNFSVGFTQIWRLQDVTSCQPAMSFGEL